MGVLSTAAISEMSLSESSNELLSAFLGLV